MKRISFIVLYAFTMINNYAMEDEKKSTEANSAETRVSSETNSIASYPEHYSPMINRTRLNAPEPKTITIMHFLYDNLVMVNAFHTTTQHLSPCYTIVPKNPININTSTDVLLKLSLPNAVPKNIWLTIDGKNIQNNDTLLLKETRKRIVFIKEHGMNPLLVLPTIYKSLSIGSKNNESQRTFNIHFYNMNVECISVCSTAYKKPVSNFVEESKILYKQYTTLRSGQTFQVITPSLVTQAELVDSKITLQISGGLQKVKMRLNNGSIEYPIERVFIEYKPQLESIVLTNQRRQIIAKVLTPMSPPYAIT